MRDADTAWSNWVASVRAATRPENRLSPVQEEGPGPGEIHALPRRERPALRPDGYRRWVFPAKVGGSIRLKGNVRRLARRLARGTARVKHVTISRVAGQWVAPILIEDFAQLPQAPTPRQKRGGVVGVDLRVHHLAALSTGELIDNPRPLRRARRPSWQRRSGASRGPGGATPPPVSLWPCPGGPPVRRDQWSTESAHARVAQSRAATMHALTKRLAVQYAVVAIEDLAVKGMTGRPAARPDPDTPGAFLPNGRAAKAGLNRSLGDAAFAEIRRQLTYKTTWYGSTLHVVDRWYPSSKTCSACGAVKATLRLADREYHCLGVVTPRTEISTRPGTWPPPSTPARSGSR